MFFVKDLNHIVELQPTLFTANIEDQLKRRLHDEVEGKYDSRVGYIVAVVSIINIGSGLVLPAMGSAQYSIKYRAILFKPFKNEVVDVLVTKINQFGFMCEIGAAEVFVSQALIPSAFKHDPKGVSACFRDETGEQRIEPGVRVRLQILNTTSAADRVHCIGTMKGDGLGILPEHVY
ncbi:RNA polymerase Rpb7 [Catenaria anguillulae PL171]|uniref:RNA polymerase Rpb7 n=1 Tax=Catenaria anguillulae PL171 TaxID=765915 RepID=A0A1Y2I3A5_9FUNG|nr:RNA polymerase Rpb7 [Catenaria anguillulae PL171]